MLRRVKLGFIGAGNMATALARGMGEPVLVSDVDARAGRGARRGVGGEASSARTPSVAEQADAVVLCHKPAQLERGGREIARARQGGRLDPRRRRRSPTSRRAYPGAPVYRFMPNIPAEVGAGVFCYAPGSRAGEGPEGEVLELFGRVGTVVELPDEPDRGRDGADGLRPAFFALVVEALVDAGVRHGLDAATRPAGWSSRRWPAPRRCSRARAARPGRAAPPRDLAGRR